jgi:hypothetical protein
LILKAILDKSDINIMFTFAGTIGTTFGSLVDFQRIFFDNQSYETKEEMPWNMLK